MKWKVNGKCSDCVLEGVVLDFAVVVDGGCGLIGEGDVLCIVGCVYWWRCGSVEVDSVMAECIVVVIMKDNEWEIVEYVVDMVVFVELWVDGLASRMAILRMVFCGS